MRDGMVAMGVVAAGANHSKPEAAIALKYQNRLRPTFAMGIQKGHAELFGHLRSFGTLTQSPQQRIHLREGDETGAVGIRDQNQTIKPLHFLKQLFDAGQQLRQRKRQTGTSPLNVLFSFPTTVTGRVASDTGKDSRSEGQNAHLSSHERAVAGFDKSRLTGQPLLFRAGRKALQTLLQVGVLLT